MWFSVWKSDGDLLYEGYSWPMARAALDFAVSADDGCPVLNIVPPPES